MKKTQIFALIIFILLAGSAWLFLSPAVSEIREVRQKIRQAKSRVEELRRISMQSEEMEKKIVFFQRDIQYLARYLPGQGGINGTLNDIRSKGIGYGLNMVKADCDYSFMLEGPGPTNAAAAVLCLETIPFNLQIEGPLPDICSYLEWLEGLPCFLGIGTLEVSRIGNSSSAFPLLRVNMLLKVLGFFRKEKESVGHFSRESDRYYPVRLSSDLVYAQKNLRITALEKDLFSPEWVVGDDGDQRSIAGAEAGAESTEDGYNESLRGEKGAVSIADLDLNGIVSYQGEYTALIDNRRVKKGDAISGMEVMWITKDSICLSKGSDKFILRLNK